MSGDHTSLAADDPLAVAFTAVLHTGDLPALETMLAEHPWLATVRFGDEHMSRTALHALTDWPGNVPNGPASALLLVAAGADVNARFAGPHTETPLHWAASSDDVAMIDTLVQAGADLEADGAVIGGGTPLADAVAFGQWQAARRLVELGAAMNLWQASALGPAHVVRTLVEGLQPDRDELTGALWTAAHGGQREICEMLVFVGADPRWVGWDDLTPAAAARREGHDALGDWLDSMPPAAAPT